MTKQQKVSKDQLIVVKANTRYAGMEVSPMDITPYGMRIDEMYHSMIETYKKHGRLLLQPIGVEMQDDKFSVCFGFTRALTFLHHYDNLCKELGVEELSIDVIIFDNIDKLDTLMENVQRQDQHFMSIAYAIHEFIAADMNTASIAKQLGYSINTVRELAKLPEMNNMLQQMCYSGVINEPVAKELAKLSDIIQQAVADYLVNQDVTKFHKVKDVPSVIGYALPKKHKATPVEAFTDINGTAHPHIKDESWCVTDEGIFEEYRIVDLDAEEKRRLDYWTKIAEELNAKSSSEQYKYWGESYVQVEMGTHPKEVAVWKNSWLTFYVRKDELNKIDDSEKFVEQKKERMIERSKLKIVKERNKIYSDRMREIMEELVKNPESNKTQLLYSIAESIYWGLSEKEKETAYEVYGQTVDYDKIPEVTDILEFIYAMSYAKLYNAGSIWPAHKALFAENNISWSDEKKKLDKEVNKTKRQINSDVKKRYSSLEDKISDHADFVRSMHRIIYLRDSLYNQLMEGMLGEKMLKYIAKNIGQPYKGKSELMQYRLQATVKAINGDFQEEDGYLDNLGYGGWQRLFDNTVTVEIIGEYETHGVLKAMAVEDFIEGFFRRLNDEEGLAIHITPHQYPTKAILAASAESIQHAVMELYEFIMTECMRASDAGFQLMTLDKKGKVRILPKK